MQIICKECQKVADISHEYNSEELKAAGLCFECHNFLNADLTHRVIIDGEMYYIGLDTSHSKGFGGRTFIIEKFNGEKITTTNLNFNGTIPEHLRDRLPDNAKFL